MMGSIDNQKIWTINNLVDNVGERHKLTQVVLDLVAKLPNLMKHKIYVDAGFGSGDLASELHKQRTQFTVCCPSNRPSWLFKDNLHRRLTKGAVAMLTKNSKPTLNAQYHSPYPNDSVDVICASPLEEGSLCAVVFHSTKKVNFFSSQYGRRFVDSGDQRIPVVVQDYRKYKGCMDIFNSHVNRYQFRHRTRSWKTAVLLSFFKFAVVNAWKLYSLATPSDQNLREFISSLIRSFAAPTSPSALPLASHPLLQHRLSKSDSDHQRCVHCQQHGINSKTAYMCQGCNCFLHPTCYTDFHAETILQ